MQRWLLWCAGGVVIISASAGALTAGAPQQPAASLAASSSAPRAALKQYCLTCHNDQIKTAGLTLAPLDVDRVNEHAATWEKVVRKLRVRMMPPPGSPRPDEATYEALVAHL